MQTSGIVHAELAGRLAGLRHTDLLAVADSGLPVPPGVPVVDLGVLYGVPPFLTVLDAVLATVTVEASWAASEVDGANPDVAAALRERLSPALVTHERFKELVGGCRFVVRTGEATPYANVLLRSGVPWG